MGAAALLDAGYEQLRAHLAMAETCKLRRRPD
jgi:hypothetical protein